MCSWGVLSESCLMMLCSAKEISSKSPCKQQLSPLPSKICACRWEGQECRQHGRKVAGAKPSRHLLCKLPVHHGTVVNTSVLVKIESFENIFQKGGTDFAATCLASHQHAWKRTSFNLTKESFLFLWSFQL